MENIVKDCAIAFVHGINNGPKEREQIVIELPKLFQRNGVEKPIHVCQWRSLGNFVEDLTDLELHEVRRHEAVEDVKQGIIDLIDWGQPTSLLVIAHSMGQVLASLALTEISIDIPISFLSLGGPLGNSLYSKGLYWAHNHYDMKNLEWNDIWCELDPITNMGKTYDQQLLFNSTKSIKHPVPPDEWIKIIRDTPLRAHHIYFEYDFMFKVANEMIKTLEDKALRNSKDG